MIYNYYILNGIYDDTRSHAMLTTIYTEECLDESLCSEPLGHGWLSKEELDALKESGDSDPEMHMEDGSIAECSAEDQQVMRQQILINLNQLHPVLKSIVDAELKRDNRVYSAVGSTNITLSKPFLFVRLTTEFTSCKIITFG